MVLCIYDEHNGVAVVVVSVPNIADASLTTKIPEL